MTTARTLGIEGSDIFFEPGTMPPVLRTGDGKPFALTFSGPLGVAPALPMDSLLAGLPVSLPAANGPQLPPMLDLSGFAEVPTGLWAVTPSADRKMLPILPVARSGEIVLVAVASAPRLHPILLAIDLSRRRIVALAPPTTTIQNVHLAPGGSSVLIEEVEPTVGPLGPRRAGRLVLLNTGTGRILQSFQLSPATRQAARFLVILHGGQALYATPTQLLRFALAPRFPNVHVSVPTPSGRPVRPFFLTKLSPAP